MKDPRFELVVGDAYEWILNCKDKFDCVIMDISDPIEAGPGIMLYTKELYEHVVTVLTPNGVFVTQAGNADAVPMPHANAGARDTTCFGPIRNTLSEVYSCVLPYTQSIPSFGADWGYVMAFNSSSSDLDEWKTMPPESIDNLIEQYISHGEASLKMYDGITHLRMFHLTKGKITGNGFPFVGLRVRIFHTRCIEMNVLQRSSIIATTFFQLLKLIFFWC
jgi:spermidine synthase